MSKYINCLSMDKRWDRAHNDFAIEHFVFQFVIAKGGWETFSQDVEFSWSDNIPIEKELGKENSRRSLIVDIFLVF